MFSSKLRVTFAASAIATASMACGGAPDPAPADAPKQTGTTFSAKASALSQSSLGITRWHSTLEPGANAAFVLDGQDRVGRVKYLSMAFIDHKTSFVHVQVLLPAKGELVLDTKHQKVISNTLPASARPYAKGIYIDFQVAHPLHGGQVGYSAAGGYVTIGIGAVITGAGAALAFTPLAPAAPFVADAGIAIMGAGLAAVLTDTASSAPNVTINGDNNNVNAPTGSNVTINGNNNTVNAVEGAQNQVQQADPSTTPPAAPSADPSASPAQPGADPSNPAPSEANPADPSSNETPSPGANNPEPAPDPSANEGAPLPSDDAGGNLDNVGPSSPSSDPPGGGSNDMPSSDPGGSSSGGESSSGGGSSSGGDNSSAGDNSGGGGDSSGSSEASHVCRKVAVSKTTKIRACIHY